MLDGGSYDYSTDKVDTLALDYVTTYLHAYKIAQRKLREMQLMPQTMEVDVGSEGDYYPLYSTILMQLPQLLQGLRSSVIKKIYKNTSNEITQIDISDAVDFVSGSRYGVVIQATNDYGYKLVSAEVTGTGQTRRLTFSSPLAPDQSGIVPSLGNHLSFGLLDSEEGFSKVTHTMKIYGNEPNGKNGYVLTLRDYNEEVYTYGGTIPTYKSNITRPQAGNAPVSIDDINKLRQDMNVLQEDLINAYQLIEMPIVVDADVKSVIVEVDEGGHATTAQRVETQVSCRQGWEERPFVIDTINVPLGWTYEVVGGKVIFTISEGAEVRSGQFKIPVIYRPIVAYAQYEDENGNLYVDASDSNYMELETSSSEYTYDVWFSYFGLSEGVYLGKITQLQDIPSICNINDYFVWGGTDTDSTLSVEGKFKQARCYKFIGLDKAWRWEVDDDVGHGVISMSDVFSIANADLQNNNSQAYEYLDHLTSNSIYTDLLIANSAFIQQLTSEVVAVGSLITVGAVDDKILEAEGIAANDATNKANAAQSTAISTASADATTKANNALDAALAAFVGAGNVRDHTIISGGKIISGLIDVDAIKATSGFFQDITIQGELISSDYDMSRLRGYKFYKNPSNIGIAEIPLLYAKQINTPNYELLFINAMMQADRGLTARSTIYTNFSTFVNQVFYKGYGQNPSGSATFHVTGYINGYSVDRLTVIIDPSFVNIWGYYHCAQTYSYSNETGEIPNLPNTKLML